MRYITNADGYLVTVSFGGDVECDWGVCTEYEGSVPTGYTSLEAWYAEESAKLHRWKIVNGQLTLDSEATAPTDYTIVDLIYPVGSIYISVSAADPADLFGGTWQRIEDVFLLAAGSTYAAGATGGEAEHTLAETEIPAHTHGRIYSDSVASEKKFPWFNSAVGSGEKVGYDYVSAGGGAAHNNMPPYLAVYVWHRTA